MALDQMCMWQPVVAVCDSKSLLLLLVPPQVVPVALLQEKGSRELRSNLKRSLCHRPQFTIQIC